MRVSKTFSPAEGRRRLLGAGHFSANCIILDMLCRTLGKTEVGGGAVLQWALTPHFAAPQIHVSTESASERIVIELNTRYQGIAIPHNILEIYY